MPKGFPIGYEMAEKNENTQTDRHFRIYISRDVTGVLFINSNLFLFNTATSKNGFPVTCNRTRAEMI